MSNFISFWLYIVELQFLQLPSSFRIMVGKGWVQRLIFCSKNNKKQSQIIFTYVSTQWKGEKETISNTVKRNSNFLFNAVFNFVHT